VRAAELLRARAVDTEGRRLGKVHDIRLSRASPDEPWRIDSLVVGRSALAYRFGYATGGVTGPAPLVLLAGWLSRRREVLPWSRVDSFRDGRLVVRPAPADGDEG
jgi:sporulation protein YlmC with PRC-barrel domain